MRRIVIWTFIITAVASLETFAQEYNGKMWVTISDRDNSTYISGFLNGVQSAGGEVLGVKISRNLNVSEFVEAINSFYLDPINRPLPVTAAVAIISLESNGASPEKMKEAIAKMRGIYSNSNAR